MDDWQAIAKWLWGLLVPAIWWMWNKQDARLTKIEDSMYTKSSALERHTAINDLLEARRKDVIDLHHKIDTRAARIDDKVDALAERMDGKIDGISRELHTGLSEIKTILLGQRK